MGVGLFGMKGGHGAVDEMKDQGDKDEGDEEAAEKEFAGLGMIGFEEQVVHGEIDTSGEALVPDRWGVLNTAGTEKEHREHRSGGYVAPRVQRRVLRGERREKTWKIAN